MDPDVAVNGVSAWVIKDLNPQPAPPGSRFRPGSGRIKCRIRWQIYGDAGRHWKEQLTGRNLRKWGKIYIDANEAEQALNRKEAVGHLRDSAAIRAARTKLEKKQAAATNIDECPGAMFVWETRETADAMFLCAVSNQELGRDMYRALEGAVRRAMVKPSSFSRKDMQWFQVEFEFA